MSKQKLRRKINRIQEQLKQERYRTMSISELVASPDIKGETYKVEAIENGFIVSFSYRQKPAPNDKGITNDYWDYKTKQFVYNTWADLVKFIGDNAITQPPK